LTNKIRSSFEQIKASDSLKASTLRHLQAQRNRRGLRRSPWKPALAFVCTALALLLPVGAGWFLQTPVSYISIDVNPSVELSLNRLNRVISATAYHEDGTLALEEVSLKGLPYTEAIDGLLDSSAIGPYLTEESALSFTVAAENPERESDLLTGISGSPWSRSHGGQCYRADVASISEAHSFGMSFGKYAACLVLFQYDDTVSEEQCRHMTMAEIRSRIREWESSVSHPESGAGEVQTGEAPVGSPAGTVPAVETQPLETQPTGTGTGNGTGHHSGHHHSGHS